ncbi:ankyrin-related unc-44 [Ditylenchus destructor]|nr:ankyrin-related unc-44 [Ditylenchus destructor]
MSNIVDRLRELETELVQKVGQEGRALPPDPQLSELMARALSKHFPDADLQIVVSTSRKTTTTKQFYETETPGMIGLETDQLRELQRKLMEKISTSPTFDVPGTTKTDEDFEPTSSQQTNGTSATTASRRAPSLQQKETTDDGFANEDGSQVVSKRMTRTVTTSQSSVSGVDAAGNIIPTDEETASQKYRNGANGTGHDGQKLAMVVNGKPMPQASRSTAPVDHPQSFVGLNSQPAPAGRERTIPIRRMG